MIARKSASTNQQCMYADQRDATVGVWLKTEVCMLEIDICSDVGCGKTQG